MITLTRYFVEILTEKKNRLIFHFLLEKELILSFFLHINIFIINCSHFLLSCPVSLIYGERAKSKGRLILEWNPEIKQQGGFWKASVDCNLIIRIFNCYCSQAWLLLWKSLAFFCAWVAWQLLELLCQIITGKSLVYMVLWSQHLRCMKTCGRAVQKTALEYPTAGILTLCWHCLVGDFVQPSLYCLKTYWQK